MKNNIRFMFAVVMFFGNIFGDEEKTSAQEAEIVQSQVVTKKRSINEICSSNPEYQGCLELGLIVWQALFHAINAKEEEVTKLGVEKFGRSAEEIAEEIAQIKADVQQGILAFKQKIKRNIIVNKTSTATALEQHVIADGESETHVCREVQAQQSTTLKDIVEAKPASGIDTESAR